MLADFLRNGRFISLALALLIVSGLSALATLPVTEDPHIGNRMGIILTEYPGASAERVESLVTEPIENELRRLPEIKEIVSSSKPNLSVVTIVLRDDAYDTEPIWSRARDHLADVQPELPAQAAPSRFHSDRGYAFTMLFALNWNRPGDPDMAVLTRWAHELESRMRNVSGTDHIRVFGEPVEEFSVTVDPVRLAAMQVSMLQLSSVIEQADAKVAAGNLDNPHGRMQIEVSGELDSLHRIRRIVVANADNGEVIRLGDVARIERSTRTPEREISLLNGEQGIVVGVRMQADVRIEAWKQRVIDALERFEQGLSDNIRLETIFDQADYTSERLGSLWVNVLVGFALVVSVLLVTLGLKAALIVSLALPLTAAFTLAMMKAIGLPIHQMSVTGLVVALGIMVDNAIVMVDLIQQKRQRGKRALVAMMESIRHLWLPLAGSTLTTVLAFAPVVLMPGPAGEFVGGIALSVIASLIGSYLISHTLIAGLAGRFLKPGSSDRGMLLTSGIRLPALSRRFAASLNWAMSHPLLTISLVMVLPILGFAMAGRMHEQFFPPSDRDMLNLEVRLPVQVSIDRSRALVEEMIDTLDQVDGLSSQHWFVGMSAPSYYYNLIANTEGEPHYANGMIRFSDFRRANDMMPRLQTLFDARWPEAQVLVRKLEQGPPFNAPVELRIYGPSLDTLAATGEEIRRVMSGVEGIIHSRSTLEQARPKLAVQIDEEVSRQAGLDLREVATQLQLAMSGRTTGSVLEGTEEIPLRIRVEGNQRQSLADLQSMVIVPDAAIGEGRYRGMPLSAIATIGVEPARGAIPRRDGSRVNVIEAYTANDVLASDVLARVQHALDEAGFSVPAGYRIEVGGESSKRNDAVGNLLANVGIIAVLMVIVVVMSFNSFRLSLIIFSVAGLSVGLGILCVWLFDYPFGFTVIIGLMGLMGLAINGAIVILAELKSYPGACAGEINASIHAVMRCSRHISSTTITTVGGFMPLILEGGGFWPPFAIAIAGGTVLTTLLSFYLAPAAFRWFALRRGFEVSEHSTQSHSLTAPEPAPGSRAA